MTDIADLIDYLLTLMPKRDNKKRNGKEKKQSAPRQPVPVRTPRRVRALPPPRTHAVVRREVRAAPRTTIRFAPETSHSRVLSNGSRLTTTTETAPTAVTAMDMNREYILTTLPNGDLKVAFCMPLIDVISTADGNGSTTVAASFGAAMRGLNALNSSAATEIVGTVVLNPMVNIGMAYSVSTTGANTTYAMVSPNAPHLGLQALAFSKYKFNRLGFAYQPQGQTFQSTADTTAESRLRFCFTADPTHPVLGVLGYRGTGTIDYSLLTETPNSVQFAEWNAWDLEIRDFHTDWLTINIPRFTPTIIPTDAGAHAALRQTTLGAISLYDSNSSSATRVDMPHGQLWWRGEVIFSDPSPLLATYVPPAFRDMISSLGTSSGFYVRESKEVKVAPEPESKEEKVETHHTVARGGVFSRAFRLDPRGAVIIDPDDDDLSLVSPPRFTPTPSHVVGGSLYSPRAKVSSRK